jgi:hypothetical protein
MFIHDLHADEFYIHCFTYPDFRYYNSFCKRGKGPNEFIRIGSIHLYNDTLFIDETGNKIFSIDIHNISTTKNDFNKIELPGDYGVLGRGIKVRDKFVFPSYNTPNDGRLLVFDSEGKYLHALGKIRPDDGRKINSATSQAWMPFLAGNENIIVAATQWGEVLDIFDADGNQRTVKGKDGDPVYEEHESYGIPTGIRGFDDVTVTKEYIFAIYDGDKIKESDPYIVGGKYIYVFDYQGNPVEKITLDRRIGTIYVDEKNKLIYALDVNSDSPLFVAQLPERFF